MWARPPRSRDRARENRLVAAARELVHRRGVARTTLADIAQEADVPVGNVYFYFKTKADIIGAVVQGVGRVTAPENAA
jgi:TetR/AcrR family transcriptional regulator, transcriptional repressor for nem operon